MYCRNAGYKGPKDDKLQNGAYTHIATLPTTSTSHAIISGVGLAGCEKHYALLAWLAVQHI